MIPLTIRPVGPGDLATLTKLAEDFHAEDGHVLDEGGRRALAAIADGEPLARAWLFELGGRAIGYGVLTLGFSVEYGGRDGFIDDLYLAPVARGRGLAGRRWRFWRRRRGSSGSRRCIWRSGPRMRGRWGSTGAAAFATMAAA
jgi:GNAT superfamily N-acetyltransferase